MQEKAATLVFLLLVPVLAGCVNPFDPGPDHWDAQVKLTVVVSARAPEGASDAPLAVELATKTFNASGAGVTYRLIQDTVPDGITAGFERLAKGRPAAFIAALGPEEVPAALRVAAARKIPLILVTPTNTTPAAADAGWFLQAGADPAFAGRALAILASQEGSARMALFADDEPYTARAATAFRNAVGSALVADIAITSANAGNAGALARQACEARAEKIVLLVTPTEAAALVRGVEEAGCRGTADILAAPWARQNELVDALGKRTDGKSLAEGVMGITPARAEPGVFRGAFESVYGRAPTRFAAPAHDAVAYATLAAYAAKGGPRAKPFQGTITGADVQPHLAEVASAPGVKMDAFAAAASAAKAGDDLDWVGYEQDFEYQAGIPRPGDFDVWRVTASGGFERTGETVSP